MVWSVKVWRRTLGGAVMVALAAASGAGAATRSSAADAAAARRFVSVETTFLHRAASRQAAERAAGTAFISRVSKGCAGAIPASAANGTTAQQIVVLNLALEAELDLAVTSQHPLAPAVQAEIAALRRLHFTRSAIDRVLASGIKAERAALALTPTHLCTDITTAAAGGFDTVPAATGRLLRTAGQKLGNSDAITDGALMRMIKADLPASSRAAAARLGRLETSVGRAQTRTFAGLSTRMFRVLMPGVSAPLSPLG